MLVTALSILSAAIVSGIRLKPYMDAGETYTPASFMMYPAIIAAVIAIPIIFFLRKRQNSKDITVGTLVFKDRTPFIALWCALYIVIAFTFFPYEPSVKTSPEHTPSEEQPHDLLNQPVRFQWTPDKHPDPERPRIRKVSNSRRPIYSGLSTAHFSM